MKSPDQLPWPQTPAEKLSFKSNLKSYAMRILAERMENTRLLMDGAQIAANAEEKSSAGDKYETSRAMNHLQKDMYARQLNEQQKELAALSVVDTDKLYRHPGSGACVVCSDIVFFIACGLAKQTVADFEVLFVSPVAPLARLLSDKKIGDALKWNTGSIIVSDIF